MVEGLFVNGFSTVSSCFSDTMLKPPQGIAVRVVVFSDWLTLRECNGSNDDLPLSLGRERPTAICKYGLVSMSGYGRCVHG